MRWKHQGSGGPSSPCLPIVMVGVPDWWALLSWALRHLQALPAQPWGGYRGKHSFQIEDLAPRFYAGKLKYKGEKA